MKHNLNTISLKYTTHELPYGRTTFQDYYCDHNLLVHTALSNNIKTKMIKRHKGNRPKLYWLQLLKRKMKTKQTTKGNWSVRCWPQICSDSHVHELCVFKKLQHVMAMVYCQQNWQSDFTLVISLYLQQRQTCSSRSPLHFCYRTSRVEVNSEGICNI